EIAAQQPFADRARGAQGFRVGHMPPRAVLAALGHEGAVGRGLRPVFEALGELDRIGSELVRRAHIDRAVGPAVDLVIAATDIDRPVGRGLGGIFLAQCLRHRSCPETPSGVVLFIYLWDREGRDQSRTTFGARFSKNALSRALASPPLCVSEATSDSVR